MEFIRFILLVAIFLPLNMFADDGVLIHEGWITGNTFRAFEVESKNVYVVGLIDGIFLSPFYGASKENLEQCTTGMTGQQVVAIFDKYLQKKPERWHLSMHVNGFSALKEACNI